MIVKKSAATFTCAALLAAGSALASDKPFAGLEGVDVQTLSSVEMDAVQGQLTVAELTAYINSLPASPLKSYLLKLIGNPANAALVNRIVAALTKLGL